VNEVKFVKDVRKGRIKSMSHMIEVCNLKPEGRHHSGIDDSNNIARCVVSCLE
jgi:inhibitor of KinA sporulation pathway (predicted exonuclease)